jgi:hypothetical protein
MFQLLCLRLFLMVIRSNLIIPAVITDSQPELGTSSLNKNDQYTVSRNCNVCITPRFLAVVALGPVSDPSSIVVRVYFDELKRPGSTSPRSHTNIPRAGDYVRAITCRMNEPQIELGRTRRWSCKSNAGSWSVIRINETPEACGTKALIPDSVVQ